MIEGIRSGMIPYYWDQLEPLIKRPLKRMGADKYYSLEDIRERLETAQWQCWAATSRPEVIDAAFVTFIEVYPTGYKEFCIYLVGGRGLSEWMDEAFKVANEYARHMGCSSVKGIGRVGWKRVSGEPISHKYEVFSWDISDED